MALRSRDTTVLIISQSYIADFMQFKSDKETVKNEQCILLNGTSKIRR